MPELDSLAELAGAVEDLAGRFALQPLLDRILRRAVGLLGGAAGSICTVDEEAGTYRKEVDLGVRCRQGSVFPLAEGTTGAVVARRGPVVFDRYADVPGGHLDAADRDRMLATVAVPIEWAGSVIGACVVFSTDPTTRWDDSHVRLLQLFAGHAAVALTNARLHADAAARTRRLALEADRVRVLRDVHATLARTLGTVLQHVDDLAVDAGPEATRHLAAIGDAARSALVETRATVLAADGAAAPDLEQAVHTELTWLRATAGLRTDLVVTGDPAGVPADAGRGALLAVQEALANVAAHAEAQQVRVGLLCAPHALTVLVSDDGRGFDRVAAAAGGIDRAVAVVEHAGGSVVVESAPAWGTRVRIEIPHRPRAPRPVVDPARVAVVDPRPAVRAGIARCLEPFAHQVVMVGGAADTTAAATLIRTVDPDVVLVGADLAASLVLPPGVGATRVLVLCDSPMTPDGQRALADLGRGTVSALAEPADLAAALVAAADGATVFGPGTQRIHDPRGPEDVRAENLTAREHEVVLCLCRGLPDKQIARELGISVKTVEKHVGAALRKTSLPNRTALATHLARR